MTASPSAGHGAAGGSCAIKIENVRKEFGNIAAVNGISLEVARGETLVLLGTSGCGKTTTLRMINRLIEPSTGTIRVDGNDVAREDPISLRRKIGYMIQGVGLFPHRTVEQNILTVPHLLKWKRERCQARLQVLLETADLSADLLSRYPHELSGGQRQRVGVARALAADPPIILMDEPFGALDPVTRRQVRREFVRIESLVDKTIVLVTHDVTEALELGDRICLMSAGKIEQIGKAADLLFKPQTPFVQEFFGQEKMQTEWMVLTLADLPLAAGADGRILGQPRNLVMSEALARLEPENEQAFLRVIEAFFHYKRLRKNQPRKETAGDL